jgi:hypothetical protein
MKISTDQKSPLRETERILSEIWQALKPVFPEGRIPPSPAEYPRMVLENQNAKLKHNILAGIFSWVLLAGYLVFPNTFNSIRTSKTIQSTVAQNEISKFTYNLVLNIPLLAFAATFCLIGSCGHILLWRQSSNFVWVQARIFL